MGIACEKGTAVGRVAFRLVSPVPDFVRRARYFHIGSGAPDLGLPHPLRPHERGSEEARRHLPTAELYCFPVAELFGCGSTFC